MSFPQRPDIATTDYMLFWNPGDPNNPGPNKEIFMFSVADFLAAYVTPTAGDWKILGNAGTTAGTNFVGTTDNQDLVLKRNSVEMFRLAAAGIEMVHPALVDINSPIFYYQSGTGAEVYADNTNAYITIDQQTDRHVSVELSETTVSHDVQVTIIAPVCDFTGTITGATWDGNPITSAYLPASIVYNDQANTYTAGSKQTVVADATNAGFRFIGVAVDPSSLTGGDMWFRSDDGFMRYYDGTTVRTFVNLAGAQTLTNKTLTAPIITNPTITVGSDATGDILYNGGSGVLARSANLNFNGTALLIGAPTATGRAVDIRQGSSTITIGETSGTDGAIWINASVPSSSNYRIASTGSSNVTTLINATTTAGSVQVQIAGNTCATFFNNRYAFNPSAATAGTITGFLFTGAAHSNQTASTETIGFHVNLAANVQHAAGALTNQRAMVISAPTYSFVTASTITNAATFAVSGSPIAGTNATITNSYSVWVQGGTTRLDGGVIVGTNGGIVTAILTASAVLDFPNTVAGSKSDLTVAVTGAALGDVVSIGVPNGSVSATDNVLFFGWVSAADTVTVRFVNANTVIAVDPASGTFKIKVTKQ